MSHENKSQKNSKPHQLLLSRTTQQALSLLLPQNYTLELLSKLKKESSSSRPTKKLFTNEGEGVVVPKADTPYEEPPLTSVPSENPATPSSKRNLRDKKPGKAYFEDKFPEAVPLTVPSTKPPSAKPNSAAEATKKCLNILQRLKKHQYAGPFLHPVDVEGLGLYNYYDVIKEPMDISTVDKKLKNGAYSSVHEFAGDIRKIWNNALMYNTEGSQIYIMTETIKAYFEKIFKEIQDVQFTDKVKDLEEKVKNLTKTLTDLTRPGSNKKAGPGKLTKSPGAHEEEMTIQEKKVLCDQIKKLAPEALRGVWEIVARGLPNQSDREELVFDIDILPVKVTRELERFVKSKAGQQAKPKAKSNAKEQTAAKPHVAKETSAAQHSNHNVSANGVKSQGSAHTVAQQQVANKPLIENPPNIQKKGKGDDNESKSSDSSFISDSDSESDDDDRKNKSRNAQNYQMRQQDLANFQAGSHGSMINSFIVKCKL